MKVEHDVIMLRLRRTHRSIQYAIGNPLTAKGASVAPAPLVIEIRRDSGGSLKLTETGVKADFAQDVTVTEQNLPYTAQAPTAARALSSSILSPAWKMKPCWYLVATADRALAEKIRATTIEVVSSHVAMPACPEEAAKLIVAATA